MRPTTTGLEDIRCQTDPVPPPKPELLGAKAAALLLALPDVESELVVSVGDGSAPDTVDKTAPEPAGVWPVEPTFGVAAEWLVTRTEVTAAALVAWADAVVGGGAACDVVTAGTLELAGGLDVADVTGTLDADDTGALVATVGVSELGVTDGLSDDVSVTGKLADSDTLTGTLSVTVGSALTRGEVRANTPITAKTATAAITAAAMGRHLLFAGTALCDPLKAITPFPVGAVALGAVLPAEIQTLLFNVHNSLY